MRLSSLSLTAFRNYGSLELDLSGAQSHLLLGENGAGKTNVLEAVSVLSLTRSCRGRDEEELVQWGQNHYRVRGVAEGADGATTLEVVSEIAPRRRKACFRNDVRVGVIDMVGSLPAVIFLPQDLLLFSGPPAERRRFLDQLLSQVSPEYLADLGGYQKVLQQRNALLRTIAEGAQQAEALAVWDRELAVRGSRISVARLELIETLNLSFQREIEGLGERWDDVRMVYERKTEARSQNEIAAEFAALLNDRRARDIVTQSTSIGPHREDWQAYAGERALPTFASRGQERTAVLALLLLEASYLHLKTGTHPLALFDDVFSELDDAHQSALLSALGASQVLMTSTRLPPGLTGIQVWRVEQGTVVPV